LGDIGREGLYGVTALKALKIKLRDVTKIWKKLIQINRIIIKKKRMNSNKRLT